MTAQDYYDDVEYVTNTEPVIKLMHSKIQLILLTQNQTVAMLMHILVYQTVPILTKVLTANCVTAPVLGLQN